MFLHRLYLNLRCKDARRDIADPYELHSTLCRAFSVPNQKCPEGEFLWRLEPESDKSGNPCVLIQSRSESDWSRIGIQDWLAREPDKAIDLAAKLKLKSLDVGKRFRYRLQANPCVTRDGKRIGLLRLEEQVNWLHRKGELHGFTLATVHVSQAQMLRGKQHNENPIRVFSVLFDGILATTAPDKFSKVVASGIGHGKAVGLGLFSVVPLA
jgi:CRISPR system Cascade subunit CasE